MRVAGLIMALKENLSNCEKFIKFRVTKNVIPELVLFCLWKHDQLYLLDIDEDEWNESFVKMTRSRYLQILIFNKCTRSNWRRRCWKRGRYEWFIRSMVRRLFGKGLAEESASQEKGLGKNFELFDRKSQK